MVECVRSSGTYQEGVRLDDLSGKKISNIVQAQYSHAVRPARCSAVKRRIADEITMNAEESFSKISNYLVQLGHNNPNTYSVVDCIDDRFERCMVIPGALRYIGKNCMPIIGLDGNLFILLLLICIAYYLLTFECYTV
jgi:hypothetical protein